MQFNSISIVDPYLQADEYKNNGNIKYKVENKFSLDSLLTIISRSLIFFLLNHVYNTYLAGWQSVMQRPGKAVYAGSIPASASTLLNKFII